MSAPDLVVRGRRIVTPEATGPASIQIQNGVITAVGPAEDFPPGCPVVEAGESVVMPGLADTHVHITEPGRTDWEGFDSATRSAAAGDALLDRPRQVRPIRGQALNCSYFFLFPFGAGFPSGNRGRAPPRSAAPFGRCRIAMLRFPMALSGLLR